jgi:phosphonate dehydrogenase
MSYRDHMSGARPRVVVTHWVHPEVVARLAEFCEPLMPSPEEGVWPQDRLHARARDAAGLMVCMADRVDEPLLVACPRLRIVAGVLKGPDNIDVAACSRRGVWVTVLPDLLTAPTAELVVGLMLAVMRRVVQGDAHVRGGRFAGWRPVLYGTSLAGATVGIIGMGRLGLAVARRVRAFDARVVYVDPEPLPGACERELGVRRVSLPELLAASDVVVPLVPLSESTCRLLGAGALGQLRSGAFVVNAGRGSVVDEEAVAGALETGRLGGYAADVFAFEDQRSSPRPAGIPERLLAHPRTVFTPHLGSAVDAARRRLGRAAAAQVRQALAGQRPDGAVNQIGSRLGVNTAQVAAYLAVIDTGGFRSAAARLGVTQGAVSQQVRRLEAELGASLIQRGPAGCRPAPGTEAFARYARTLADVADRAARLFRDPELVVGAASNIGTYLLQPLIKTISDRHSGRYRIRQYLGSNSDVLDRLVLGAADIAITEWWDHRPGFEATRWRDEDLVVIAGPGHRWWHRRSVTVADLAGETILGGEPASGTATLLRTVLGDAATSLPAAVNLGSTAAVKEAVHAGLGVSLVLAASVQPDVASGRLRALPLDGPALRKSLWIARPAALTPGDPAALFTRAFLATAA